MKNKKSSRVILIGIILSVVISCGNKNSSIAGKWAINGTSIIDTSNSSDNLVSSTSFSDGAEFSFENDGTFDLSNQGKKIISGDYIISEDQHTLTLKSNNTDYVYDFSKNENDVTLTSVKNKSIIKIKKETV